MGVSPAVNWRPQFSVCIFIGSGELAEATGELLASDRYVLTPVKSVAELWQLLECRPIDCLVVEADGVMRSLAVELKKRSIFLPIVIFSPLCGDDVSPHSGNFQEQLSTVREDRQVNNCWFYHAAEVQLPIIRVGEIAAGIDRAIVQFLKLSTAVSWDDSPASSGGAIAQLTAQSLLQRQQQRLAEKLRERLGYLGVYYKRNPQNFLRNLSGTEKHKLVEQLKLSYRQIVLKYFDRNSAVNNQIDEFVCLAFFADVPVTQIVEIHMELMDEFATQLKLEGRSEEILLDYRLTLIDAIAHLCEMYRRSIPKDESSNL